MASAALAHSAAAPSGPPPPPPPPGRRSPSSSSRRRAFASASAAHPAARALADLPPAHRGQRLGDADTPALIVDLDAVEANCGRLRAELDALLPPLPAGGAGAPPSSRAVTVRPHFKAHKCPELTALTLRALGQGRAVGACAQKLGEAEALVWSGALGGGEGGGGPPDVCITNEVAPSRGKMARLAALARHPSRPRLSVVVDSALGLRALAEALQRADDADDAGRGPPAAAAAAAAAAAGAPAHRVGVLVEVNAGQDRCGVDSPAEAADLAQLALDLGLDFRGLQAYHGGIQHVRRASNRRDAAARAAERAAAAVAAVQARGIAVAVVTGGGSGTCLFDAASGVYTEVQPGSLFFGDADYARNEPSSALLLDEQQGGAGGGRGLARRHARAREREEEGAWERRWRQAAWVATTVASRSEARGVAVVDAGLKAVALDSGPPRVLLGGGGAGGGEGGAAAPEYKSGGDEHGILLLPAAGSLPRGAAPDVPPVGEVLRLLPGHCDPQFNLYDWVVAYRSGGVKDWRDARVEAVWRVAGRGPGS